MRDLKLDLFLSPGHSCWSYQSLRDWSRRSQS